MASQKDLTGSVFGRWQVIKKVGDRQKTEYMEAIWLCRCLCGTERELGSRLLLKPKGGSRSCGCARKDTLRLNPSRLKHGLRNHRLYATWKTMRQRCKNPGNKKYPRYGGRGISVCERWDSFENFLSDMGPTWREGLTIDRRDNDGNYEPGNCRWVTCLEQANNTSNAKRDLLIIDSEDYTDDELEEWDSIPELKSRLIKSIGFAVGSEELIFYKRISKDSAVFALQ